ncbi:hypothetical protein [Pseudonocardia sp. GCM10023141]|uniref:hypothetical protein n=1 Tax=Pseudonocardia sp. GCM10023141 TaxID=3252653 RepID=UPI0036176440
MLPAEVVDQLAGPPVADTWEPVFPLLTVDPGGEPRVCLLSRAELVPRSGAVLCALRSRRTTANLRRTGIAVLQVVTGTVSWSVRTRIGREIADLGGLAVELLVTDVERDTLGIPLRPMTCLADAALAATERWDDNAVLFARLAAERDTAEETRS